MDNIEYTIKKDEIRSLIAQRKYAQAAEIADTIDWRRIRSVMMLCTVSDLYKVNRRYEDAKNMLLLAYEIRPGGRSICYSLCGLCIKLEEIPQAVSYYKEFVQAAPRDPDRYILQYRLYEAQEVELEERIEILKHLKQKEYREKWAYELAYLYHRIGQTTLCVEECDELILWFGDGKYVYKAMELKMRHQPLSPSQQKKYDHRLDGIQTQENAAEASQENVSTQGQNPSEPVAAGQVPEAQETGGQAAEGAHGQAAASPVPEKPVQKAAEPDIQVKIMDVGQYNTMNLQAELAAGLQEVLGKEDRPDADAITRAILAPLLESDTGKLDLPDEEETREDTFEDMEEVEVFFGETGEMGSIPPDTAPETSAQEETPDAGGDTQRVPDLTDQDTKIFEIKRHLKEGEASAITEKPVSDVTAELVMHQMQTEQRAEEQVMTAQPPRELARVLSQESDGQISIVVPEREAVEKQITGQMSISDILAEWERRKQENAEKCREEVRQHILQQTGGMFTEFETSFRDGLLEKLESGNDDEMSEEIFELDGPEAESVKAADLEEPEEPGQTAGAEEAAEPVDWELPGEPVESLDWEETEEPEGAAGLEEPGEPGESLDWEETEEPGEAEAMEESENLEETVDWEMPEEPEEAAGTEEQPWEAPAGNGTEDTEDTEETADPEEAVESGGTAAYEEPEEAAEPGESLDWEETEEPGEAEAMEESESLEEAVDWEMPEESEETAETADTEEQPWEAPAGNGTGDTEETADLEEDVEPGEPAAYEESEEAADREPEDTEEGKAEEAREAEVEYGKWESIEDEDPAASREWDDIGEEPYEYEKKQPSRKSKDSPYAAVEREAQKVRELTREERELFAPYIQVRAAREQLVRAIDNISMAAYTGNIIITGEEGTDTLTLAKNMIHEVQAADSNFSGKVAKILGRGLNQRSMTDILEQLKNGALIIMKAAGMEPETARELHRALQQDNAGIIIVLEDTRKGIARLFAENPRLKESFTARMDVEALSNETLASFGRKYAREKEYSIDDMGMLALHRKIEERQTLDHVVTVVEVKRIMDEAIRHASKKTFGHFMDILFARRYDEEDMIILTEKDFMGKTGN